MADQVSDALLRQRAMSRWDDEGGAGPDGPQSEPNPHADQPSFPKMDAAEMQALHVRVIALESLVVALLTSASEQGRIPRARWRRSSHHDPDSAGIRSPHTPRCTWSISSNVPSAFATASPALTGAKTPLRPKP
jgi:hypothetical protein